MRFSDDKRNILHVGPPLHKGDVEITPAMVDAVRHRIDGAGDTLTVWAMLREDKYETLNGDGFYLHVRGIALNPDDAQTLIAMAGDSRWVRWHIKSYPLGLNNGLPAFLVEWPKSDEFDIGDFVEILSEIPAGASASRLHTGAGRRADGPSIALPAK